MKKISILISAFFLLITAASAQKFMTRTGHISFYSNAPVEKIEAHHYQCSSLINMADSSIVFQVLIKGFEFENARMQEHFNENYLESDKYPRAVFKGKILNLSKDQLSKDGIYPAEVEGEMEIHGVKKMIKATGTIEKKGDVIVVKADFPVTLKDYNITIPSSVTGKIAETVDIKVDMELRPYKR